jgi:ankyrin repeat protein
LSSNKKERSDVAKFLIECGTNVNSQDKNNRTPLHFALQFGHLDTARLLLDHGADANAVDSNHVTPIHLASQHGYLEIVKLLLLRGANHDSRDKEARTALHLVSHGYALCHSRFGNARNPLGHGFLSGIRIKRSVQISLKSLSSAVQM